MNKTISINLGGFFFHIDEDAYQKLSRYFDAVKRSLAPDGRDEIMKDIESRIAELFQERIQNEKQVIGLVEIDAVIGIMGQPEDYKIDEEAPLNSNFSTSNKTYNRAKRLYRDKDNSLLGGVAAGFGHYLNIDPLWVRILFIIATFISFGTAIIIYLILWILIPEAITTSQKLEMKGEPINISNIERKVKEGIDEIADKIGNIDHQKIADNAKNGAGKVGSSIADIFGTIFKIFAKFIGAIIVITASFALLGFIISGIVMMFSSTMPDNYILNHIETPIGLETPLWVQGILFILVFGIPFFFLLLLGLKLLVNNLKSIGNVATYTLIATWVIASGIAISLGINEATQMAFEGKVIQKEEIILMPTDTLYIKFKNNDFYSKNTHNGTDFRLTQDENNKDIIYSNNISIEIMETDEAIPYIQIEKLANGKSASEAKKRAEKIKYGYKIEGNTLILDNYLISAVENKFRGQEVELYLYLPKGTLFKTDKNFKHFDYTNNDFFDLNYDFSNGIYKVEAENIICLNCPSSENNYEDNETNNDSSSTIILDANGVLIKKPITIETNDVKNTSEKVTIDDIKKRDSLMKKLIKDEINKSKTK
jgi:phage shock protein PspC (stress-responsive transcriptional regulator)